MLPRSHHLVAGLFVVAVAGAACFPLDRVLALSTGGVVGQALRPDLDNEGAGFTTISGVGSNVVRRADDAGRFEIRGLAAGRFDLRLVDDVDGDGWADRGRDLSVLIAADGKDGDLGSVDVGPLPLTGSLGLVGDAPAVDDDSHVVRIYALRGRCTTANGDATALDLDDGACADTPQALATRLEHGVDAETAVDSNGDWQLTRVVAGRIDVVAARHVRNADGSLGAVVEVGAPFPYDGVATDRNDAPTTFPQTLALTPVDPDDDDVQVQLQLSRTIESSDAFAAFSTGVEVVPACSEGRATAGAVAGVVVVPIDRGSRSVVTQRAAGRYNVVVCDGEFRGSASSLVAMPAASAGVWPVVLREGDSCPLDPNDPGDASRDCDADGRRGLPLSSSDSVREACAAQCFPDGADARDSLGAALGDRTCTVEIDGDDAEFDCDDDADGQPDVTEPLACIGAGRGTDLDGDGLCSVVDSYPHCADNTALGCPVGVEDLTPRRVAGGGGGVRIRGPVGTQIEVLGTDPLVTASIDVGATLDGQTLVYGETTAAFDLDDTALTIAVVGDVPGIVCARTRDTDRDIVGCEFKNDLVSRDADDNLGGFFNGGNVVVGGLPEDDSEGRYVAFSSGAAIADNTESRQVFWRDRGTGVTVHVSARDGEAADAAAENVAISADGLTVAFSSSATNLVDDDGNATADIFVWRAADPDVLERIVSATGVEGDGFQTQPALNADGSIVAFTSTSSTLAAGITGTSTEYVLRKDLVGGGIDVVSVAFDDGRPVSAREPAIADDGNRIAFWSFSSRLIAADTNGNWDIFVRDTTTATTKLISTTADGSQRGQGNESTSRIVTPAISGDGRFVSWSTTADVVPDDTNGVQDVFVTAVDTGVVVWASVGNLGTDTPRGQGERAPLSRDGGSVVFSSRATTFGAVNVANLDGVQTVVPGALQGVDVSVGVPAISATAAYVVVSGSNELDPRFDSGGSFAVFTGLADAWWSAR